MNTLEAKKQLLSCPGDTIQETIESIGMTQAELAERLGRSVPKLNELIKGKAPVTRETATRLEYVLGIPADFWLKLEHEYQNELHQIKKLDYLEQLSNWVKPFPVSTMKRWGILPDTNNKSTLAESLLKFFRVASPAQWSFIYRDSSLAFKIALKHTVEPEAISVWLRLGEVQAEKIEVESFDKKKLRASLLAVKDICYQSPDNWLQQLQRIFADSGVALVYTPGISKAPVYGATRWIKNNTIPLIQVTDRHKDYNSFWFTLYHELGHILHHGKKDIFIEGLENIEQDNKKEKEADNFAVRMLITEKEKKEIFKYLVYNARIISTLSKKFRIHESILVSQLQRERLIPYNNILLTRLKQKVVFEEFTLSQ